MFLRPVVVKTGRLLTLTAKHYDWDEGTDPGWGPGTGGRTWAISDQLELFTFSVTRAWFGEYGDPGGNVDISGPKILNHGSRAVRCR